MKAVANSKKKAAKQPKMDTSLWNFSEAKLNSWLSEEIEGNPHLKRVLLRQFNLLNYSQN